MPWARVRFPHYFPQDFVVLHLRLDPLFSFPRSPSPEPTYDSTGKRLNSRENRIRRTALDRREQLLEYMVFAYPDIVRITGMYVVIPYLCCCD